ncbi:MAG TPA: DEDD exonuclease domain-containing protein [Acidimicrobiia bacterium]|nr:DEDD exonuclease domain-containing protein [Acidimicrobiia bacterium]
MTLARQASFDDMGMPLSEVTFCVLDLETTGSSAAQCEITEIGGARYRMGEEVGVFQTLVNPGSPIPPFITILTGITQTMVTKAPSVDAALPAFLEFIGDAVIVGHNIRFDMSFLSAAARRLGYAPLTNRTVDTVGLARRLIRPEVRNLRLSTLADYFRSPVKPTHRALDDARATAHVLWGLLERAGSLGVTALEDLLELPTARGSAHYGKIHLADDLPRRPGVYLFKDRNGTIFYIGKASNLRSRVRSYFYGDERRSVANMLRELDSVEYRVCESTLEAEVTEIRLIHGYRPRHNRRSRPPKASHFVKLTSEAFPRLSLVRTVRPDTSVYLGPFRSRRAAETVMLALWDAVPVRRCTHKPGSRQTLCAMAQIGAAMCPCDGTLSPEEYAPVVETVRSGVLQQPDLLLEPLRRRIQRLAEEQRFEEAATVRDRHQALARALERRRAWQAMQEAGMLEVEARGGDCAVLDRGHLVHAWRTGTHPPLNPAPVPDPVVTPVPPDVMVAEEAHLLWKWMTSAGTRLVQGEGALALPVPAVPSLTALE